jgi:hypothetical protein
MKWIKMKILTYFRNRGWVIFYLEDEHRKCNNQCCWLKLYESEEKRR